MGDPWITTYTGKQFFITQPAATNIFIADIAHGLSNICRYVGQCKKFYSVAEHSVRMARALSAPRDRMLALLHDAPEAYMGDVSSGLKSLLPRYEELESQLFTQISSMFCDYQFDLDEWYVVKRADKEITTFEVLSLFEAPTGWTFQLVRPEWSKRNLKPWSPKKAEREYLKMFWKVQDEIILEQAKVRGGGVR